VETHARETSSRFAALLLHEWNKALPHFWHVVPKEYVKYLAAPEEKPVQAAAAG
jgi:glutamate synthase (NADPH/NADH) large chain